MDTSPTVPQLLQSLEVFATSLADVLSDPRIDWRRRPAENEWSLAEVMCHLRDVEVEVHQVRFRLLIAGEFAFLPGVAADEWADERGYCFQDGQKAANSFVSAREETLALVEPLDDAMWQRQGRHAFFGHTSMHELLHLVVRHDEIHWQQITALLRHDGDG